MKSEHMKSEVKRGSEMDSMAGETSEDNIDMLIESVRNSLEAGWEPSRRWPPDGGNSQKSGAARRPEPAVRRQQLHDEGHDGATPH